MLKAKYNLDFINLIDKGISLGRDFKKIPREEFAKILNLVIYYSKKELEILFYLNYDVNLNYVITIPKQKVSKYRVNVNRDSNYYEVDLNGDKVNEPLIRLGSMHSHHRLETIFSLEDDLSDFSNPPGLHLLIGEYPNLQLKCSFVINKVRYYINPTSIIDYDYSHCYVEQEVTTKYKDILKSIITR